MSGKVEKIRPELDSTGPMIVGMLAGNAAQVKHIAAVVIWDDDSFQVINDPMPQSKMAFAVAVLQKKLFDGLDKTEE